MKKKHKIGRARGTHGADEKFIQNFGCKTYVGDATCRIKAHKER